MADIVSWAQGQFGFFVDRTWAGDRWQLGPAPIRLAQYHADILAHCFTPGDDGRLPYDVIAWCEPAKGGKSAIAGLVGLYAALHWDGDVVLSSNKRNQAASVMFRSLTDSITYNPHLHLEPSKYEVEFSSGNVARAIPSNARGQAGARFSLFLADELWGAVYTDGIRLWDEHKSDPTRRHCVRMAIGYAGYLESELWHGLLLLGMDGEPVKELAHIANDDGQPACWANGRHFTFWSHTCRQPWQTPEWIESQRASLREPEYRRMILTQFVEGIGNFLDADTWAALVDPQHKPLPPGSDKPVYLGLDIASKPGGDDCALIGVYSDDGQVKVAFHKVWYGGKSRRKALRLSETVEPYIKALAQQYRVAGVWFDPFQALQLAENLRRAGIQCVEVPQTHASRGPRDTELFEMCVNGELVLYPDDDLVNAAAYANAKELGNGLLFLTKAGRGKIDLLISLANVACEARARQQGRGWHGWWSGTTDDTAAFMIEGKVVRRDPPERDPRPLCKRVERVFYDTI